MNNPIAPIPVVATPDDMEALMEYCDRFNGSERLVAITCAAMAWNLAYKMVQKQIEGEAK
jgi:hypothetical protein